MRFFDAAFLAAILLLSAKWASAACPTAFELEVVVLVNAERANQGLAPFQIDDRLTAAAQGHARDMAQQNFFSHTGSNGSSFDERIHDEGYAGGPLAENIAAGYSSPASVVAGWMDSPGHRANILNASLDHIGVGHILEPGTQYGNYWSQSFGGAPEPVNTCGDTAGTDVTLARCQTDQLRALSGLCRADLGCRAHAVRKPDANGTAEKLAACLDRRRASFEKRFGRAAERAARELAVCALSDSPGVVASGLQAETAALAASVTAGQDPADPADGKLRSALLRGGGRLCSSALGAEAKHARKPDAAKLAARREKARTRFDGQAARLLTRAADRGTPYDGASVAAVADAAEAIADARVQEAAP